MALLGLQRRQNHLEPALQAGGQAGGPGSSDSNGLRSLTMKGRFQLSIGKKVIANITQTKPNKARWETEKEKPTTATATMLAPAVFSPPFKILLGRVSAYFSRNTSPAWGPSDSAVPDVSMARVLLGYREGSEGGNQNKYLLKNIYSLSQCLF